MKRVLYSFLVLLMLTSSLACAMPTCVGEAKAETASSQPCADHHPGQEQNDENTRKVSLLIDCMGVDLQKADTASIDKPDLKTDFVVYIPVTDVVTSQLVHADANTIRGPPYDWLSLSQTQPSLLLTTQRFRI